MELIFVLNDDGETQTGNELLNILKVYGEILTNWKLMNVLKDYKDILLTSKQYGNPDLLMADSLKRVRLS